MGKSHNEDYRNERSAFAVIPLKIYQISYKDNAKTLSLICLPRIA